MSPDAFSSRESVGKDGVGVSMLPSLSIVKEGEVMRNRRVYILGAGSSRELRFPVTKLDPRRDSPEMKVLSVHGPLSSGFFYHVRRFADEMRSQLTVPQELTPARTLTDYIREYYEANFGHDISLEDLLYQEDISNKVNMETLYRTIEEEMEREARQSRNQHIAEWDQRFWHARQFLVEYLFASLSLVTWYCRSCYHRILAEYVVTSPANVISFNWDTLLDEQMAATGAWHYEDGYGFRFGKVVYEHGEGDDTASVARSSNLLLKPHGSLDWYRSTQVGGGALYAFIPITELRGNLIPNLDNYRYHNDEQFETAIVPPGRKQRHFTAVWKRIEEVLSQADEIVAIGFSFNANDEYIKREFEGMRFRDDLTIGLVDPNADDLKSTYADVFRTSRVAKICDTFSDYCEILVQQPRMEQYAELLADYAKGDG
jgi:hypothetical protein